MPAIMWHLIQFKYAEEFVTFWLTEFFHSWPHITYQGFKTYSSTFDPDDVKYVQTLIFWGAIPVLWLVASLFFVIIYGICHCCKNRKRRAHPAPIRQQRTKCLKWMIIMLALLSAAFVGGGFYGNEATASGVQHFVQSTQDANDTIESADQEIGAIYSGITVRLVGEVNRLEQLFREPISNTSRQRMLQEETRVLKRLLSSAAVNISKIDAVFSNNNLDLSFIVEDVRYYEMFRWLGFIGVFCFELIICLTVLCGACTRSKCSLASSAILCVIGIILVWCLAGAELSVTIGISDFCDDPNTFIVKEAKKSTDLPNDLINYYIKCDKTTDPFSKDVSSANKFLALADATLDNIAALARGYYDNAATEVASAKTTLDSVSSSLLMLSAHLDCTSGIHKDYTTSLYSICYDSVLGITVMLLSAVLIGLVFTVIILCTINLNGRLPKRKIAYAVDQEDPFLPPNENNATLERYRRNVEPARRQDNPPAPLPSDHRARPISLSSSLQGYRQQSPKPNDALNLFNFLQREGHEPGPSSSNQHRAAASQQRGANSGWGAAAASAAATAATSSSATSSSNQPSNQPSNHPTSREGYDSPPPSYTLAMSRDNQRRNPENQRRNQDNRQQQRQDRLSSGSLV